MLILTAKFSLNVVELYFIIEAKPESFVQLTFVGVHVMKENFVYNI